ncbi:MAG: tRNA lysidine(34) synthetase TilS [Mobilitalea sp.]
MIRKVYDYSKKNNMIDKGDRIVVGVSGGADSVCLLHILSEFREEMGITIFAVHINHGIRGKEAKRDEQYVEQLCRDWNIDYSSYQYDVKKQARVEGISEEEAGRKLRYQAFQDTCRQKNCSKIAVAHNKNDNAETVLFHLFRGTGIKGLTGIEPMRVMKAEDKDIVLIRPLLCLERSEIEEYLKKHKIAYQTDSTNLTEDYSRNKIRHKVLAYATCEINSGSVGNIASAALQLKEIEEYLQNNIDQRYQDLVKKENEEYLFSVASFCKEPVVLQKGMIRKILENLAGKSKDLEAKHVDEIMELCSKQVGRQINLPYGIIAHKNYEDIRLYCGRNQNADLKDETNKEVGKPIQITIPGQIEIPQIKAVLVAKKMKYKKDDSISKSSCEKWFDYDKIENTVEIRTRKEGDYIQINDLGGRKKLKDYFIDHKIPSRERDNQILIADGSHIMWILGTGERMSEKYKVDETTTNILLMKMIPMEENENGR